MYDGRKERIVATIEARMTSTRLPGKVLMPLAGKPALSHLIERLKRSAYLDVICVATTINAQDDPIADLAQKYGVVCFRGSEQDVLGRVLGAARFVNADIIVETTGDCPAIDHAVVDRGIKEFFTHDVDYVDNCLSITYPNGGFEVQVFRTSTLAEADRLTQDPVDRAHVSYYIYRQPEKYRLYCFKAPPKALAPDLRFTLDVPADYTVMSEVFNVLYPRNPDFTVEDVVAYLRAHPELAALNKSVIPKAAYEL